MSSAGSSALHTSSSHTLTSVSSREYRDGSESALRPPGAGAAVHNVLSHEFEVLFAELGSKDADTRTLAAKNLGRVLSKTSKRLEAGDVNTLVQAVITHISGLLVSRSKAENLGGVLASQELAISQDNPLVATPVNLHVLGRNLMKVFPPLGSDLDVINEAVKAVGAISSSSALGAMRAQLVVSYTDKALEWLEHGTVRHESKRYAAALVLADMLTRHPQHAYSYIPRMLKAVFAVLHDTARHVRVVGLACLQACLKVWRGRGLYPQVYSYIEKGFTKDAKEEVTHGSLMAARAFIDLTGDYICETHYFEAVCDATLMFQGTKSTLLLRELLLLIPRLAAVRPDAFITYKPEGQPMFSESILKLLLRIIAKDKENRHLAIRAFGLTAVSLRANVASYVDRVFTDMRSAMTSLGKKRKESSWEDMVSAVCDCTAKLAEALGPSIATDLLMTQDKGAQGPTFIDMLFDSGLSEELIGALKAIATHIPAMSKAIQWRTLDLLSTVLQDQPYRHPGAPREDTLLVDSAVGGPQGHKTDGKSGTEKSGNSGNSAASASAGNGGVSGAGHGNGPLVITTPGVSSSVPSSSSSSSISGSGVHTLTASLSTSSLVTANASLSSPLTAVGRKSSSASVSTPAKTVETQLSKEIREAQIVLALKTLRTFEFDHVLTVFARDCVTKFLTHDNDKVREEAGITCAEIVVPAGRPEWHGLALRIDPNVVTRVLAELLTNAISDLKSSVRRAVIQSLSPRLDRYLAKVEVLRLLFVCLHDTDFETRKHAITVVGRLAKHNPAYVNPTLRQVLINLLSGLEFRDHRQTELESAILMGHLIRCAPQVVQPYVPAIMNILLTKIKSTDFAVASNALEAIGEIADVANTLLRPHLPTLMPIILDMLRDQLSAAKRETGLRVLGQLCRGTGYVSTAYEEYPLLMEAIFNCLTEGQTQAVRLEASRALGILGALDPHRAKNCLQQAYDNLSKKNASQSTNGANTGGPAANGANGAGNGNGNGGANNTANGSGGLPPLDPQTHPVGTEEYFQDLAVRELLAVAYNPSLSDMHDYLIRSMGIICVKSGLKVVSYLPQLIPALIYLLKTCAPPKRTSIFKELGASVKVFTTHLRPYLDDIMDVVIEFWLPANEKNGRITSSSLHIAVMNMLRAAVEGLGREMKNYVPKLLRHFMSVFAEDETDDRQPTQQALEAIALLGSQLEDSIHPVVNAVISVLSDASDTPMNVRLYAIETLETLIRQVPIREQASSVIHALCTVVVHEPALRKASCNALLTLMSEMGPDFDRMGHRRTVRRILDELGVLDDQCQELMARLQESPLPGMSPFSPTKGRPDTRSEVQLPPAAVGNRVTQQDILRLARDAGRTNNFDWPGWIMRFSVALLKESRSPSLAACQDLAMNFQPFARRLFNAAFISCWVDMTPEQQVEVTDGLERAMRGDQVFMQMMLNVAEFMSHHFNKVALPISSKVLGAMAFDSHAYAKALRYKEAELQEFFHMPSLYNGMNPPPQHATPELLKVVEDLIEITQALQEPEAAQGVLAFIRQNTDISTESTIQPSWYEKLGQWDKALDIYQQQIKERPNLFEAKFRMLSCLDNLGKWEDVHNMVQTMWPELESSERAKIAPLGCTAATGLGKWDAIATYVELLPQNNSLTAFSQALLAVHRGEFDRAQDRITEAREALEPQLTTLWSESYSRGYPHMVMLQRLAELEEIIYYKLHPESKRLAQIRTMWQDRINGCQSDCDVWQDILEVRALVLKPEDDCNMWLKYSSLCRKAGDRTQRNKALALDRSHTTLVKLLGSDPSRHPRRTLPLSNPRVAYAYIKHLWHSGRHEESIQHLCSIIDYLVAGQQDGSGKPDDQKLLARCYQKLGSWQAEPHLSSDGTIVKPISDEVLTNVIESFRYATLCDRSWYKAWHSWAFMNFQAVTHYKRKGDVKKYLMHTVVAVKGFFNSIALCEKSNLQDTLRLLTLLFDYGGHPDVAHTISAGLSTVSIDTWLQVIPQLIARIQISDPKIRSLLHDLLLQIGRFHPQALLFPLTVAAHKHKATSATRREAAEQLLHKMREHSSVLVEQALMVSEELIRVAVLWNEMWHEGLEEASRLSTEHDIEGMFGVLTPLHMCLQDVGPDATERENEFVSTYGKDLKDAWEWLRKYQRTKNSSDITAAWDHYYHVYRKISKALPQITSLELREVSPKLLAARNLQLVVPGTYLKTPEPVCIHSFATQLTVINSKQRPRKLTMRGDNGVDYQYLLKAHEDLRQDERVMQLFGLVNVLLKSDPSTSNRPMDIMSYFVLPLSPNLGLIEWVPTCDTMHALIKEHRERNRIILNIEVRLMLQMTPDYDGLTNIQKVEVFRYALANSTGDDLARVMWLQSGDSETWLDRRSNYIRSLAVMSMVGYILGLGDRHPSNLMIDRQSGAIMHVDFGDCFEVAMHRPKFPEKIPFRLTRMLVAAMEVCGVDGTFRITCENVMELLRNHADSLMAVLEAFLHDPLIDWFVKARNTKRRMSPTSADDVHGELEDERVGADTPNRRAHDVIRRVKAKLGGTDFFKDKQLDVAAQVSRLIKQAMAHENLCQHYTGWCPFW